jgi:hypothetical protein
LFVASIQIRTGIAVGIVWPSEKEVLSCAPLPPKRDGYDDDVVPPLHETRRS